MQIQQIYYFKSDLNKKDSSYPFHKQLLIDLYLTSCNNYTDTTGVTNACKPASFPSFVTASKLVGKNND